MQAAEGLCAGEREVAKPLRLYQTAGIRVKVSEDGQEVVKPSANSRVCSSRWGQEEALVIVAEWGEDFICVGAAS